MTTEDMWVGTQMDDAWFRRRVDRSARWDGHLTDWDKLLRVLPYHLRRCGILRDQLLANSGFVVGIVESRRHRRSHQRPLAAGRKPAALPHVAAHYDLRFLPVREIDSKRHRARSSIWMQLQRHCRISHIEMKDFGAWQPMQC